MGIMLKLLRGTLLACALVPASAMAALVIDVYEYNGNVVFEASGTLDLEGVAYQVITISDESDFVVADAGQMVASIEANTGSIFMVQPTTLPLTVHLYDSAVTPAPFGTGGAALASDYFSDGSPLFGLLSDSDLHGVFLTPEFIQGSAFSQSMVFEGTTFAELGIAADASYIWSWSNGETVTMSVSTVVPEPATYAAIIGAAMLGLVGLRRWQRSV